MSDIDDLDLLDTLLDAEGVAAPRARSIPRRGLRVAPLSPAQRRLWFLHELDPSSTAYTISGAVLLTGPLDAAALEAALKGVIDRHEALRTTFEDEAGEPRQVVQEAASFPLDRVRGGGRPAEETVRIAAKMARRPWDLKRGPLLRAALIEFSPIEHALAVAMHHIIADGWSIGILLRELGALYRARVKGVRHALEAPPIQYADYAAWQTEWLEDESLDTQLAYWRARLAGAPETIDLPSDRPRPASPSRRGGQHFFDLSPELTASLGAISRREGATLFMTLLAATQTLLFRYTGQDDVVVGSPISGRNRSEIEGLIGFFVNTLVLRTDLSGDPTFSELLGRVRETALGAYAHQDLPFERLVEAVRPAREMSRSPLFQVMFAMQNVSMEELDLEGLVFTTLETPSETAQFDLTLTMTGAGGGLRAAIEYSADLFDAPAIVRMAGHLTRLLEGIAAHSDRRLSWFPLMPEAEERLLLVAGNDTRVAGAGASGVHEIFEDQARRTPDAVAVQLDERRLTYRELDHRSSQVAHLLREAGVGPDRLVALYMERSLEMVAGILGIQKAGGAYLPLDPSYPGRRLSSMLSDSRAEVLLTQSGLLSSLPDNAPRVIPLDPEWTVLEGLSREAPASGSRPENLAYVIYTSGSTGRPKGVMISHRALANHMRWMGEAFPLAASDSVLQKTPFSFDASVWEFYAPLLSGARLILARPGAHQDASSLIETIQAQGVTTLQLVPSMLALMLESGEARRCTSLGRVFCGGEPLSPELQERFFSRLPADLHNLYGPTEAAIDATFWTCERGGSRRTVPIGSPIANMRAYVLDARLRPVPPGVRGELYLAGTGLARGYLGDPALTAERFLPDPFSVEGGERLYRTGDSSRRLSDGTLEFLGRIDEQVKLRGHRIEPGEIEAALAEHPSVLRAAVVVRDDDLAAYVVMRRGEPAAAKALRSFLGERLPQSMIPSRFTALEALPLTPSGKIDRRALPAPDRDHTTAKGAFIAPRTAAEEIIAGIWSQLLRIDRIGGDDNFFDLGGHSLSATRAVARIRGALGVDLPLRALFDAPTVRGLARRVEAERHAPAPPIGPASPEERRGLSYAQRRLWFLDRLEPGSAAYNIANAIRVEGELRVDALGRALSAIVRRHETLRTRFEEGPGGPLQIVDPPKPIEIPVDDLASLPREDREREAARRAGLMARESFDLARGPVLRSRLLRLGPLDHVLVLVVHHIAADGWSMGVLVSELATAYAAFARGEEPALPGLALQYADWAAWQRAWLQGGEMDRQLAWWRGELGGLEPLSLPTDRPRPARSTYAGHSIDVRLDQDLVGKIEKLARSSGATLHMALLAAFAAVLGRWSGQRDFGIGTPVANRTREEAEPLIGFFVNSLVVRARLEGARLAYRDLLDRIREATLGAYANQDVPFDRVVEALRPERDLSRTPLFQVMLILQNAPAGDLDLGGVKLGAFDAPIGTSTFDLTLSLSPAADRPGPEGGALDGFIEYSTELFEEATIRRLWDHFARMLETVAEDPDADVRRARLLAPEERALVVEEWSGRRDLAHSDLLIQDRFAAQAAAHPGAVAAVHGDRRVTYGEIDDRSARLAALLADLGVGPETRVGLCVDRSPEMLVGMLAALRAGGAFVPLDPDHPRDRLAFSLEDAGARVALATRSSAGLVEGSGRTVVLLDDDRSYAPAPLLPARRPSPESLAYLIYTSGTTGRPKGVMVSHRAIADAYVAWERLYGLGGIRRHLQMAGIAFDVCTGDVVRALGSGATLIFCERERLLDPRRLFDLALREQVELAEFVPAVLRGLAAHARGRAERLDSFRIAIVGSDVWTAAEIEEFRAIFGPGARLANSYGVTEATIDSTCWFVGVEKERSPTPPIGRPLAHTTVHVLDDGLEPVPPGVTGELYLGGPAVARGYTGRPDLTAERFVPDPFGGPGARLYRTGDRARWLPDGRVAFAGRADDQVKIRGQRIEPAEVEAAIALLDGVAQCAVVVRRDPRGVPRLAAYVVARGAGFDQESARRLLRERLPEAMIPQAIVALEAMPLTPNGKVDRRRLPEPEWGAPEAYEPPATGAEAAIAAAFAGVLGIERAGAGDDFFALGGHSLLATQVVSRLRESLGVEVPLRSIFESPTVRSLAARAEALIGTRVPPPVRRASAEERRRPSYAQRRLWFLDRLEPGSASYNLPSSIRLEGDLDVAVLERALAEVVRRHEALRTRFVEAPDGRETATSGPEQEIDPPSPIALDFMDLSGLREEDRRIEEDRLTREEARRPFDLARGPLLRARLLRLRPREHLLLVTLHHIVADGWSLGVLVRELGALCAAHARGEAHALPDLAVQYADWAAWQRAWLEGGEMERQLDFWRAELEGAGTLALASDRPRPARPTHAGASLPVALTPALRDTLSNLAREEGATLSMALLAGFAASLGRWSGQREFAVGVPVANRRTAESEALIGFFVNTLAVRARLGGSGLTFRGLLRRMREASLGAYANQDVPFERIVEDQKPDRRLGHNPIIQTLFALQNAPIGEIALPGLTVAYDEPETGITRFDVELFLAETAAGIEGAINYSTELFDRDTVARFVENLAVLLQTAVEDPDRALADLPALAPAHLHRVLVEWNAAREPYPDLPLVHALFERRAALAPDAEAALFGEGVLSYGELNARANQLARALTREGTGPEDLVAVCVERSFDMLVALLATMKAGAAYVPVDPGYPPERIRLLLEDSGARIVLTQSRLAPRLPSLRAGARAILLDAGWGEIAREETGDLALEVSPDALVYSVYTSGSTGVPKGVAMSHRAISNLLSWQRRDSGRDGAPRTLQFASLSFDVSFQEIFSTLTAGGTIVLVTEDERRDTPRLLRLIDDLRIERLFVPFVALDQIAETAESQGIHPASLREIDTAGEQLRITPAIAEFFARVPGCRLVNHYGPSETHLVTTFELAGDPSTWPELPAIGRPIANAPVYLLDVDLRPVPIGVPGEIFVGGAGLARGYHARPDLTAERFVPDPFSSAKGARLYRTGDLARFGRDGDLEFLGRADLQVKVRGYRVEPGEIEAALSRHPAVRQAAVKAHEHRGGKRLAAYVVLDGDARAGPGEIREHLARALPEFMVPAAIVALDALPLTPNGKIDRGALPEPEWGAASGYVAPRTPEEEVVCGIFAEVLDLDRAGAADDFFDLGGHSLLATQVISRVRRAFGAEVPLRALFESPTPAGIAAAATAARHEGGRVPPPIRPASPDARRALSFAQRRLWFLDRLDPGAGVYNLPVAVRLEGDLDVRALRRSLTEIVRRHEALRTRFVEGPASRETATSSQGTAAGGPEQIVDAPAGVHLDPEDPGGDGGPAREAAARRLLEEEATVPFDLACGPMLRLRLLRLGPRDHVLSLVAHHISADGWSMAVLLRELGALYGAFSSGAGSPLPELPVQYADWSAWQREWLEAGELGRQLAWWRGELDGAPPALDLATDRARPATATYDGTTLDVRLPAGLRSRLQRLARSEGATLHMVLLAAYAWTLMRHSGQREIVVGTPVANRRAAEAEDLVGFFVNTLAVRVRGGGDDLTYRALLARVREASLGAYANQDVPFERVVEEIQPERSLNRAPLFQTAFALQNARLPEVHLPGLRMTPIEVGTRTAKFDVMLTLGETPDGLEGAFEYNTGLFDRETIEAIAGRFTILLDRAAADPDAPLASLDLSDGDGERRLLAEWNDEAGRPAEMPLLHEIIEGQAERTPESPALAGSSGSITYANLEERANRLANHLRGLGVGPERRAALVLERSPGAIVAMIAVLKAGGAYVPLDPAEPEERLRALVEDCGAVVVVTESRFAEGLAAGSARLVLLDRDAAAIALSPPSRPGGGATPGNLAYVIYTSGSTGRPKGVGVEHRQIAAYVAAAIDRLGIRPGWRFALVSTLAADLGHTSIFPALATGGCLHLLPPDLAFDAAGVETFFADRAIDALKIVPSHLQALMSGARPGLVLPRSLLVLGGEAAPGARLASFRDLAPGCRVANHYGPTETTVGAIAGFPDEADAARATLPLGRPLANSRAYVLDDRLRPQPSGVPGEIFLGGSGVARGYLGRPGLTADRFVPDPFSREPGARMYRTGDRARRLRDGRLEFLGRADDQVKVRGFRVETGEIRAAIESHPEVREAAVLARADAAAGHRLVAWVVPDPRVAPTVNGLRRRALPAGIAVAELNRNETDYIYREIFELRAYVRHGITLRDDDTVFDVGANIGLFTLFTSLACASPRIFAFEPNPHLQPILRANAAVHAPGATVLDVGLSEREGAAPFTFYPGFSLLSGLHADAEAEKRVVKAFIENQGRAGDEGARSLAGEADLLLDERLAGRTLEVPLTTLSSIVAEHAIERIHLLKVNVEKSELEVLRGVREEDWSRIDQAVVEVDVAPNLAPIVALFERHGFDVHVDQDPLLERTDLRYVYAARRGSGRGLVRGAGPSVEAPVRSFSFLTADALRAHVARTLPGYMQPSAWVFLEALPLTANGKIDRARLPEPAAPGGAFVPPRGEIERAIAGIWSEALGVPRVGANDNFFDLGGHSLLLARVHGRLREALGAGVSVVDLFRYPTVASLATRLAGEGKAADDAGADRERGARRRKAARLRTGRRRGPAPGGPA